MTATCLSLAPNLRCQYLSQTEIWLVLVPPILEIIFCISLCVVKRGPDRKHFLLAGDGLLYFVLALFDTVAHLVTTINTSLPAFKGIDITIGILSAGPLLMFAVYLAMLSTEDFLPVLPIKIQRVTKYIIFLLIPLIILLNVLGSFLNLEYISIRHHSTVTLDWRYLKPDVETFINSLTLVILIAFQAICFVPSFLRLMKALSDQRRIDSTINGNDNEAVYFNGVGWVSAGIKLGAVETLIGFFGTSFCMVFLRRMFRLVGRACLIIGAAKGMDVVEDFSMFNRKEQSKGFRLSRPLILSALLGSPHRSSAFRPMSEAYDRESKTDIQSNTLSIASSPLSIAQSLPAISEGPDDLVHRFPSTNQNPPNIAALIIEPASPPAVITAPVKSNEPWTSVRSTNSLDGSLLQLPRQGKHVIVRYGHNHVPTLDLRRFSKLEIPGIPVNPHPDEKDSARPSTASSDPLPNPWTIEPIVLSDLRSFSLPPTRNERMPLAPERGRLSVRTVGVERYDMHPSATTVTTLSRQSAKSFTSDSLEVVQALALQFPPIPPPWRQESTSGAGRRQRHPSSLEPLPEPEDDDLSHISRSDSGRSSRSNRSTSSRSALISRSSSLKRKPVPRMEELEARTVSIERTTIRYTQSQVVTLPPLPSALPTPVTPLMFASRPSSGRHSSQRRSSKTRAASRSSHSQSLSPKSRLSHSVEYPWMPISRDRDVAQEGQAELDAAWQQLGDVLRRESIKSVGSVDARRRPSVSTSSHRGSMAVEWSIYDVERGEPEHGPINVQGTSSSVASVISDSPTLGGQTDYVTYL